MNEELYDDLRAICGCDPVIEFFNMMALEHHFPENFCRHILFRIDKNFREQELQKVVENGGLIDPQYTWQPGQGY